MKRDFIYWLRWVAVLPGAWAGAFLVLLPLHWILSANLAHGQVISGVDIRPIEYMISPFVSSCAYVLSGHAIAPEWKFKSSITITFILLLMIVSIFLFFPNIKMQFGLRSIFSLVGLFLGLYIAWRKSKFEF